MVRSTTGKAGGYVKFPRTAVWPGNIATPLSLKFCCNVCFSAPRIVEFFYLA